MPLVGLGRHSSGRKGAGRRKGRVEQCMRHLSRSLGDSRRKDLHLHLASHLTDLRVLGQRGESVWTLLGVLLCRKSAGVSGKSDGTLCTVA